MSVKGKFTYECSGCWRTVDVDFGPLKSDFRSFSGRDYGLGVWHNERPDAAALCPEGWMAFDPYTRCCYCPDCVAEIFPEEAPSSEIGGAA